jgi:hypothetical protein
MAATLTDVFSTNLYLILIGKMYSVRDVGFYDRAQRTQQLPITLMMGITNGLHSRRLRQWRKIKHVWSGAASSAGHIDVCEPTGIGGDHHSR